MPSSISSSSHRIPQMPYIAVWLLVLALFCLTIGAGEMFLRSKGYLPSINDDMDLWSNYRSGIYKNGEKTIVITGSSRMQMGIDPATLAEEFPGYKIVHLAINGSTSYATVKSLLSDPGFKGLLIIDFLKLRPDATASTQEAWEKYYQQNWTGGSKYNRKFNLMLKVFFEENFVLSNSIFSIGGLIKNGFTNPLYIITRADRFREGHFYEKMSEKRLRELRESRIEISGSRDTTEPQILAKALRDELVPLIRQHEEKGGQVVFVRMPTTDQHWTDDQKFYSREDYWNQLSNYGLNAIHFADYAELSGFDCPDTSHLTYEDSILFTKGLAKIMKGMLTVKPKHSSV